jgi:hypothetical protein
MRTETHLVLLLILLAIFLLIWPILQTVRFGFWLQKPLQERKPKIPKPLKPQTIALSAGPKRLFHPKNL